MMFFWILLTPPPAPACVLWMDHQPKLSDYYAPTCPLELMAPWDYYELRLIDGSGDMLCKWPSLEGLTIVRCMPVPANNYHIEVWLNTNQWACDITAAKVTTEVIAAQCPDWLDDYRSGRLELRGPFDLAINNTQRGCKLPSVINQTSIATHHRYEFLQDRLTWYGFSASIDDWQNQWDENIRGAADVASVPAATLKAIMGQESRYWPAWTGDQGEVGLIQLTDDGADNALRWSPELFDRYCPQAVFPGLCQTYDLLNAWEQSRVRSVLMADLQLQGWPIDTANQVKMDLWTYAHILAASYCQVEAITGTTPDWNTVAAVYHAGGSCIQYDGSLCANGKKYLEDMAQ